MSFSNWNLLPTVLRQIPSTPFKYRLALPNTVNEFGQAIGGYGEWIDAFGIVQPGSEQNEHVEGLDLAKRTISVWIYDVRLRGAYKNPSSDQVLYEGMIFNVVQVDNWVDFDNFCHCTCQEALNTGDEVT